MLIALENVANLIGKAFGFTCYFEQRCKLSEFGLYEWGRDRPSSSRDAYYLFVGPFMFVSSADFSSDQY